MDWVVEATAERDIGDSVARSSRGQRRATAPQTDFAQVAGDRQPVAGEHAVEMRARATKPAGDSLGREVGQPKATANQGLGRDQCGILAYLAVRRLVAECKAERSHGQLQHRVKTGRATSRIKVWCGFGQ